MVELVDALDSKSSVRKDVGVRFSPGPPKKVQNTEIPYSGIPIQCRMYLMTPPKKSPPQRQTSLETANEMFKTAFAVKKTQFLSQNPELSDAEITKKTAEYFKKLSESSR